MAPGAKSDAGIKARCSSLREPALAGVRGETGGPPMARLYAKVWPVFMPGCDLVARLCIGTILFSATMSLVAKPALAQVQLPYLFEWGGFGVEDGQFYNPAGVAVDNLGNAYVADSHNLRLQKFTASGAYLSQWGFHGLFGAPLTVVVDANARVYMSDARGRLQIFDSNGVFLREISPFPAGSGVALDRDGNIYATDAATYSVKKFSNSGTPLAEWGFPGHSSGQFDRPEGIAVDSDGHVYV